MLIRVLSLSLSLDELYREFRRFSRTEKNEDFNRKDVTHRRLLNKTSYQSFVRHFSAVFVSFCHESDRISHQSVECLNICCRCP